MPHAIPAWSSFAVLEAIIRSISSLALKSIGLLTSGISDAIFATGFISIVQLFGSGLLILQRQQGFQRPTIRDTLLSIGFAVNGIIASSLVFVAYQSGGDIGTIVFIGSCSALVGLIMDWIFFHEPFRWSWISGIMLFLIGTWAVVDFPTFSQLRLLPVWVWQTLAATGFVSLNQVFVRCARGMPVAEHTMIVGLATVLITGVWILLFHPSTFHYPPPFWVWTMVDGVLLIGLLVVNLLSFRDGASIGPKVVIVRSVSLVLATILGVLFYGESLTAGKIVGIILFGLAFRLLLSSSSRNPLTVVSAT